MQTPFCGRIPLYLVLLQVVDIIAAKEVIACYYGTLKVEEISCENGQVISIARVIVSRPSVGSCTNYTINDCPRHVIAETDPYYLDLETNCSGLSSCQLNSQVLWSEYVFPSCGNVPDANTKTIRTVVEVQYNCTQTDSTTSQEVTIIETTTPVSTQSSRVTHSQTTDSQTTQGGPTDRQLASTTLENDDKDKLPVIIVAPVLGTLLVISVIILVICLKRKREGRRPKHSTPLAKHNRDRVNTYEDVPGSPEEEEVGCYGNPHGHNSSCNQNEARLQNYKGQESKTREARVKKFREEDDRDDGFYDSTPSFENEYSLAGPIITDSYAVIQKKVTKEGPCFAIQDVAVEDEVEESSSEGSHVKSSLNFSNEVYNLSLPVKVPDTVLIDNDLYESCNEDSETDDEKEVVEFIDNDLYSTG